MHSKSRNTTFVENVYRVRDLCLAKGNVSTERDSPGRFRRRRTQPRKALLERIVAMLTKLGRREYAVREDQAHYTVGIDPDPDSDADAEGNQEQTDRQPLDASDGSSHS